MHEFVFCRAPRDDPIAMVERNCPIFLLQRFSKLPTSTTTIQNECKLKSAPNCSPRRRFGHGAKVCEYVPFESGATSKLSKRLPESRRKYDHLAWLQHGGRELTSSVQLSAKRLGGFSRAALPNTTQSFVTDAVQPMSSCMVHLKRGDGGRRNCLTRKRKRGGEVGTAAHIKESKRKLAIFFARTCIPASAIIQRLLILGRM